MEQVEAYLALECDVYVGLTGFICDDRVGRGAHLDAVARRIPLDRLLIETDGPYILPRTMSRAAQKAVGGRCEPMHLVHVLRKLAEHRHVAPDSDEFEAMAKQIHANSLRVFGMKNRE